MDYLYGNNPFLELEQSCMPNSTTCSTNSTTELLHGRIREEELKKQERSSYKHPLSSYFNKWLKAKINHQEKY
jgi:hypothetical protein